MCDIVFTNGAVGMRGMEDGVGWALVSPSDRLYKTLDEDFPSSDVYNLMVNAIMSTTGLWISLVSCQSSLIHIQEIKSCGTSTDID